MSDCLTFMYTPHSLCHIEIQYADKDRERSGEIGGRRGASGGVGGWEKEGGEERERGGGQGVVPIRKG